jgi:hypothetical protein
MTYLFFTLLAWEQWFGQAIYVANIRHAEGLHVLCCLLAFVFVSCIARTTTTSLR